MKISQSEIQATRGLPNVPPMRRLSMDIADLRTWGRVHTYRDENGILYWDAREDNWISEEVYNKLAS